MFGRSLSVMAVITSTETEEIRNIFDTIYIYTGILVSCHIHIRIAQNLHLSKVLPRHQNFITDKVDKVSFIISWPRNGVIYLTPLT